jgi:phosphoadenosine phosphosulfate reductase
VRGLADTPLDTAEGAPLGGAGRSTPATPGAAGEDLARSLGDTLREAVERHGDRVVLLCSFQKEESVLIDELLHIGTGRGNGAGGTPIKIATIDTGVLFPETLQTWKAFEERFGIDVEVHDASNASGVGGPAWTGPEHCCSAAKVAALERALEGADGWITGIRREQGPTRSQTELIEQDAKRGLHKYNPLALWSEKDLWARIFERDLPYNPLHDQGYASIGCAPCTLPGEGREGRWAGSEKTECGLHVETP